MQLAVVFNHGFYLPHIERVTGLLEMRGFLSVGSGNLASHHIHERAVAQIEHGAGTVNSVGLSVATAFISELTRQSTS